MLLPSIVGIGERNTMFFVLWLFSVVVILPVAYYAARRSAILEERNDIRAKRAALFSLCSLALVALLTNVVVNVTFPPH